MPKIIFFLLFGFAMNAQIADSLKTANPIAKTDSIHFLKPTFATDSVAPCKFKYKQLIIPAALIGYGVIGMESDWLKGFNSQIREEVTEDIDEKISIDDFSQYAPMASVYALNAFGVQGKHNLRDRSMIMASSYLMMSATVFGLKSLTHIERPDGTSKNSFPSGHTATAFAGAEFLWQEYKDQSIWYGIAGYAVASGTGIFRMVNNRHWLTDVAAGAGIGILSTKLAYWMYPYVKDKLFPSENKKVSSMIAPFYNGKQMGCGVVVGF
ncbi:phospholipid phosphatase [Flavobacterium noncentrifugens]|uniref:PAP2 superfamily protein n=1 Tax=Flavobacterium noncentrifugens TaxID=1128970 RepID=A0A1G8W7N0_9FLAO|nr:phosphatase PAP2 family protein [Flavobacterium noncentrifugens]GEP50801.1 phospholipid phosphatase [Flavobacterium noncentrifugens]SDJ74136.1 PAP2 superfamily protein [Flavobacterium noncentrifugens]